MKRFEQWPFGVDHCCGKNSREKDNFSRSVAYRLEGSIGSYREGRLKDITVNEMGDEGLI